MIGGSMAVRFYKPTSGSIWNMDNRYHIQQIEMFDASGKNQKQSVETPWMKVGDAFPRYLASEDAIMRSVLLFAVEPKTEEFDGEYSWALKIIYSW